MKRLVKRGAGFAAVLFITCVFAGPSHALKINIDPPRIEVSVKPGEEKTGFILVQNKDETGAVHIKTYIEDLVYLPDGSNDFLPLGSTPWSLGDNIKIGPTEFDLPPGKQEMVRYVVSLPKDAKGGRYGVIFFESAVPPSEFQKVGANVNVRLGSVVLLTAEDTEIRKAKLKDISINTAEKDKSLKISCTVYNESNVIARPNGTVKIIDMDKAVVAEIPINKEKGGVLPDTARTYSAEYKDPLKKGVYYAQLVLDYGGESLLGGQKKFEIK